MLRPMGISDWGENERNVFKSILVDGSAFTMKNLDGVSITTVNPGKARGKLVGGNLSVFVAMLGSKFLPDPSTMGEYILFLEGIIAYFYNTRC